MGTHRETKRHREAFEIWWENDCRCEAVVKALGVHANSVTLWREWFDWDARASARNAALKAKQDRDAVARRLRMQDDHRRAAQLMRLRGTEFLGKNNLRQAKDAIAAVKTGVEIERQVEGLPTVLIEILNASPDELQAHLDAIERGLAAAQGPDPDGDAGEGDTAEDAGEPDGHEQPAGNVL